MEGVMVATVPQDSEANLVSPQPDPANQSGSWAAPVSKLRVSSLPAEAINLNVEGRHLTGPLKGFGQLWQKTYWIKLADANLSPQTVIRTWKERFPQFWPKGNRFYGSGSSIATGDVAVLNLAGPGGITGPGGAPLISTGVMVIYSDDESFSFMTPEGHMFAGMITFNASEEDPGITVAQVQALVRANDPIYEASFRLGFGHKSENDFWLRTLESLAGYFGVNAKAQLSQVCVDKKVQWSEAGNIWQNAAIRTGMYYIAAPVRWVRGALKG
jgi:hypothetical protein